MKKTDSKVAPGNFSESSEDGRYTDSATSKKKDKTLENPHEDWNSILAARAKTLALPADEVVNTCIEVLTFTLAYETYCIETAYVREVYPLRDLTPLPCTPLFVMGMINVRGQVLSVIDLRVFFDLPKQGIGDLNKVIILSGEDMEFGILADAVFEVTNLSLDEIQSGLPTLTGVREKYLKGISADRQVILDARKLLTDHQLVIYEEVL